MFLHFQCSPKIQESVSVLEIIDLSCLTPTVYPMHYLLKSVTELSAKNFFARAGFLKASCHNAGHVST